MEKLQSVDWRGLYKSASNTVKKYAKNMSELEIQVEDATNAEVWGPHGSMMSAIADASYDPESYRQIMSVLWRRLREEGENWRMCYKALLLLEFLVKHGPARAAQDVRTNTFIFERLSNFQYKDANGRDHGQNVRHRAKEIVALVNNDAELRAEREKARANRAKYTGVSADDMRSGVSRFGDGAYGSRPRTGTALSTERPNLVGGVSSWAPTVDPPGGRHSSLATAVYDPGMASADSSYSSPQRLVRDSSTNDEPAFGADASHVIGRRPAADSAAVRFSVGEDEAVEATKARLEALRLAEPERLHVEVDRPQRKKKLLTDVKVNPKIAASLGLKMATPGAPATATPAPSVAAPQPAQTSEAPAGDDLIGGLLGEPAPAPVDTAPRTAEAFDPFATLEPTPPQPAWDAFGGGAPEVPAVPEAPTNRQALPEDLFAAAPMGAAMPAGPSPKSGASADTFSVMLGAGGYGAGMAKGADNGSTAHPAAKADPFADLFK